MSDITLKTGVNTRAPLASRLPKKRPDEVPSSTLLHHALETTYDIDYAGIPIEAADRRGNRFSVKRSTLTVEESSAHPDQHGGGGDGAHNNNTNGIHGILTSNTNNNNNSNVSGGGGDAQLPHLASKRGGQAEKEAATTAAVRALCTYKMYSHPISSWESEAHAATRVVQPEQQLNFFSNVRKIEQVDDEHRGGVGTIQRAVEIRTKREEDPIMRPPEPVYVHAEPVDIPIVAAHEKRLVKRNYLDVVECMQLDPDSEHHFGFTEAPNTRLPGEDLSQALPVQSKIITKMGTSHDLFRGVPKYLNDKPVSYAGHVPRADRNLAAMHGSDDDARRIHAKSYMTLAVHGGGVDATIVGNSIRARHRSGKNAPAPKELPPKKPSEVCMTTEGRMLQQTFTETNLHERKMNIRDDKQGKNYF